MDLIDPESKTISQHAFKTALKRKFELSQRDKNLMESFFEEVEEEMPFSLILSLLNANKKGE